MDSKSKFLTKTIEQIYEASLDDNFWDPIMESLRKAFNGNKALIFTPDLAPGDPQSLWASTNFGPEDLNPYLDYYFDKNIWEIEGNKKGLIETGSVIVGQDMVSNKHLHNSEWFNDFLKPLDIQNVLSGIINNGTNGNGLPTIFMSTYGGVNSESFGQQDRQMCVAILPHVQNSMMLRQKYIGQDSQRRTIQGLLDSFSKPSLLLDETGIVMEMNDAADSFFKKSKSLRLVKRRLSTNFAGEQEKLRTVIANVVGKSPQVHSSLGPVKDVQITRQASNYPYHLTFHPLPRNHFTFGKIAAAVLYIRDPEMASAEDPVNVSQIFDLTRAEWALCQELLNGLSVLDAADVLGITQGTARQRLKVIFRKTDTNSQSSLMRLLLAYHIS